MKAIKELKDVTACGEKQAIILFLDRQQVHWKFEYHAT